MATYPPIPELYPLHDMHPATQSPTYGDAPYPGTAYNSYYPQPGNSPWLSPPPPTHQALPTPLVTQSRTYAHIPYAESASYYGSQPAPPPPPPHQVPPAFPHPYATQSPTYAHTPYPGSAYDYNSPALPVGSPCAAPLPPPAPQAQAQALSPLSYTTQALAHAPYPSSHYHPPTPQSEAPPTLEESVRRSLLGMAYKILPDAASPLLSTFDRDGTFGTRPGPAPAPVPQDVPRGEENKLAVGGGEAQGSCCCTIQ
ncbi:hypothetical protein H0H92_015389 [Tricholoma furcatifolium]|nr:hypothetical protein H0H92_015389 [Tricholoma furcatifolium]